jgi:hypothetical protein
LEYASDFLLLGIRELHVVHESFGHLVMFTIYMASAEAGETLARVYLGGLLGCNETTLEGRILSFGLWDIHDYFPFLRNAADAPITNPDSVPTIVCPVILSTKHAAPTRPMNKTTIQNLGDLIESIVLLHSF